MNICYVTEYFLPFNIGGAEISVFEHAKQLVKVGHKVVVVTPNYGTRSNEALEGIEIYRFPFKKLNFGEELKSIYFTNPFYYFYLAYQVYKEAKKYPGDIIHAQNTYSIIGSFIAAKILKKRFFVTSRDYGTICALGAFCLMNRDYPPKKCNLMQNLKCLPKFQKKYHPNLNFCKKVKADIRIFIQFFDLRLRTIVLKGATKIITISDAQARIYETVGINPRKMTTVYNLPPEVVRIEETLLEEIEEELSLDGKRIILYVGKMSFGKGTDIVIQAIPQVVAKIPNACFVFVGRKNPLISIPPELNDYVRCLGHLPTEKVYALYNICHVVVFPSVWPEPLGRIPLEAMAMGKPIVATDAGGIAEIVSDGENGLLVERNDPESLSRKIIMMLVNPDIAKKMGECGRSVIRTRFDRTDMGKKLSVLYESK
ncbi:D-inositol-3-phosphate glycosyltransferase [subsurface metagenome]